MKEKEVVQLDDVNVPETGPEHRRLEERVPTMVTTRANDETDGLTTQSPPVHTADDADNNNQRRSYDGLNSMILKNRHWYDVTDGSETNLAITTESK